MKTKSLITEQLICDFVFAYAIFFSDAAAQLFTIILLFRYSALTFAFLQLEYNIQWYRSLLETSIDNVNLQNINIKNCVGTVLALNGYRKYYYIYSAKRARQFIRERNNVSEALGLDDVDEISDNEADDTMRDFFFLSELLDGLAIWMDKIFDGSMKRVRIDKWPEMKGV